MLATTNEGAGEAISRILDFVQPMPEVPANVMLDHVRSALARKLPEVRTCRPHDRILSVAGGGPSLEDTAKDLTGYIAAINGSLGYLTDKGILPDACGLLDPGMQLADIIVSDKRVRYFVASTCHPRVFDKLKDCLVTLWHPSGAPGLEELLVDARPNDWFMVGGGATMGLRWINLGYVLGFRQIELHGVDSSFRKGVTHAYPDYRDEWQNPYPICGFETNMAMMQQAMNFGAILTRFSYPDIEPVKINVHGDGLLPYLWREWKKVEGEMSPCEAFARC